MITHLTPTGWQVIYQRAHALLAAQIIAQWHPGLRPAYAAQHWQATLAAIAQHDDAGREWEGEGLLTPSGTPKDFRVSAFSARQPRLSVQHAQYQGRYVALLQAQHVRTLYSDLKADDAEMAALLDDHDQQMRRWRRALGLKQAEAEACYRLLKWGDECSLILCQRHLPLDGRAIDIETGPDGTLHRLRCLPEGDNADPRAAGDGPLRVTVEPWPFEPEAFTVFIETTVIEQVAFKDDAELVAALQAGDVQELSWEFQRA